MSEMRETLFRGKRLHNECEWIYGSLMKYQSRKKEIIYMIYHLNGNYECIIPDTRGEYTGLNDKNGKKIFEGDIVETLEADIYGEQRCFPVVCVKGAFWLYDKYLNDNDGLDFLASYEEKSIEVIGNIYDNSELLQE